MAYAVLTDETRKQLEQERSRLLHNRSTIEAEITAQVTAEVDRTIKQLNAMLDSAAPTATRETRAESSHQASAKSEPVSKVEPAKKGNLQKTQPFNAKQLKAEFKNKSTKDAIAQIMQKNPTHAYAIDELITALYDPFNEDDLPSARKSVSAVLIYVVRSGEVEKMEGKPARYKLTQ